MDGKVAQTSHWVEENQTITLLRHEETGGKIFRKKLEVLYEDNFIAVINKPAGYPTSGNYFRTIQNALPYNLSASKEKDALPAPLPAHRLDNPTSGLLLTAKTRPVLAKLNSAFENKEIQKTYLALTHGKMPATIIYNNEIDGKSAITRIKLLRHINRNNSIYSLMEAMPETGRTHQIRRHLADNGFPIVGDKLYGKNVQDQFKGLYLTALALKFNHPLTGTMINLSVPHPKKFRLF